MKLQVFDKNGKELFPVDTKKAKKLVMSKKAKPIRRNPPQIQMVDENIKTKLSAKLFDLKKKRGNKGVVAAICAIVICALALCAVVVFAVHHHNGENTGTEPVIVNPTEQTIVDPTEPTPTKPTKATEEATEDDTDATQSTTYEPTTTTQSTTRATTSEQTKSTTKATTQKQTKPAKKPTTKPTEPDGGDNPPVIEDEPPMPEDDDLPVL